MFKHINISVFVILIILSIASIAGLFWINYRISALEFGGTDFLVNWSGTRGLIIKGVSPYIDSVTSDIQGITTKNISLLNSEGRVLSTPLYGVILSLPFAMIENFQLARALWTTSQQIALVILILVMLRITKWRPKPFEFTLLFLGLFLSNIAISVFISGNMIPWISMLFVLGLLALSNKRDDVAGGVLALTTCQPQAFFLTTLFILLWAITNRRRLFVVWFFGSLLILVLIGIFFVPDWLLEYVRIFIKFFDYFPYVSPGVELAEQWPGIGVQLSWVITILVSIILLFEWWVARSKEYRWLLWTAGLTLVLTRFIGLPVHPQHNFVLFIPLILVFSVLQERWHLSGRWIIMTMIIVLFLIGWLQYNNMLLDHPDSSSLGLLYALPIFLLFTLYWVRWWAVRPPRLYIQEMLSRG